uniref:KRAB domain-containing protein n=1 Tax=Bos indicus x Bos taurus TaxID=30522 RepID=A0A4W2E1T4_BOBOX
MVKITKNNFLSFPYPPVLTWSPQMGLCLQVSVSFEDMTVDFRREEWQHLDSAQRFLYQDMTLKTTATSSHWVWNQVPKPEVIFKLEQGEGPWTLEEETPHQSCSDV